MEAQPMGVRGLGKRAGQEVQGGGRGAEWDFLDLADSSTNFPSLHLVLFCFCPVLDFWGEQITSILDELISLDYCLQSGNIFVVATLWPGF